MLERMSGSWLNVAASISMPVESSRPVLGHLTITTMARSITMASAEYDQRAASLGLWWPAQTA
jgi:hypothetical protein